MQAYARGSVQKIRAAMRDRDAGVEQAMHAVFLTPHQKPTSGGVNVIHAHAVRLARRHQVTILVRQGQVRAVAGCRVAAFDDAPEGADVVVLPADMEDPHLVDAPRITFLQGVQRSEGSDLSPTVVSNISDGRRVIAVASWLVDEARARGGVVHHVPSGLDHRRFRPPRGARRRPVDVVMLSHPVALKGTDDGLEAIRRVRARRSRLRVTLFGTREVDDPGFRFIASPRSEHVARLFRSAKVAVSPSHEEGFGLPGLEAMACGAALVTTDSKGPRDYADHGVNALVVAPARPVELADAVERLLADRVLRRRLAGAGITTARGFPDWDESSRRFEDAVAQLLG